MNYVQLPKARPGFGSVLERAVFGGIDGVITPEWTDSGLELHLRIPAENVNCAPRRISSCP